MRSALCAAALLLAGSVVPGAAQPSAERGQQVVQKFCAVCHMPKAGAPALPGAASVPAFAEIAKRPDFSADLVAETVTNPPHPRPPVPLSEAEIADVAAYIETLN